MGKIDFTAMKNSRKAIEDKVEDNIPTELEESYSDVWDGKEKITTIELSRLKPYMDKNGGQPYKINPKKVEQIAASAADIVRSLVDSQNGLVEISDIVAVLTDREDKKAAVNTYENIRKSTMLRFRTVSLTS